VVTVVRIGNDATMILGDCREVVSSLDGIDAVISDPPYGIGAGAEAFRRGTRKFEPTYERGDWDNYRPDLSPFLRIGRYHLFWGGQYFTDQLPVANGWVTWIKRPINFDFSGDSRSYATTELAWRDWGKARHLTHVWDGGKRAGDPSNRTFCHPSQKPLEVMEWCVEQLPAIAQTVLDPFMGSGTTGVACAKHGRKFIGIEINEGYFETACRRIQEAYRQSDLFVKSPEPKPEQLSLLGAAE
jgi:DNA modification methylase